MPIIASQMTTGEEGMQGLGDLLELLHDASAHVGTLEVEYWEWKRPPASNRLLVTPTEPGKAELRWQGAGPWPQEEIITRKIWFQRPDRARVEVIEDGALALLAVRAGMTWWRWDPDDGASSGSVLPHRPDRGLPPILSLRLLEAYRLLATMRFEPAGRGQRAGRDVVRARAFPRRPPTSRGELSFEFEFDSQHGSVLRTAELEDGRCVREREARHIVYDGQIASDRFVFVAPGEH
jgi:hypothetical protein